MRKVWLLEVILFFIIPMQTTIHAQSETWPAWDDKDIVRLGDDNSGTSFALSNDTLSLENTETLQLYPVVQPKKQNWHCLSQVVICKFGHLIAN